MNSALGRLAWGPWLYGLFGGFIGGGAGAIGTGVAAFVSDPMHFSLNTLAFFKLVGTAFLITGTIAAAAWLAKSPLPEVIKETTEKTTTIDPGTMTKVETTIKTREVNPKEESPNAG